MALRLNKRPSKKRKKVITRPKDVKVWKVRSILNFVY